MNQPLSDALDLFAPITGQEGLNWLETGNPDQQSLASLLHRSGILQALEPYQPSVAGTFPIGLDIPGSDLDLLCEVYNHAEFIAVCQFAYAGCEGFEAYRRIVAGEERSIVRFVWEGVPIELFGQGRPPAKQNGCVHMIVEKRLLTLDEPYATEAIRKLKQAGLKTEPAFAQFYRLAGEPYQELYRLCDRSEHELRQLIFKRQQQPK